MSLRHSTTANVVPFCDGAQLLVYTRLVFNSRWDALRYLAMLHTARSKYLHILTSEALILTVRFLKPLLMRLKKLDSQ